MDNALQPFDQTVTKNVALSNLTVSGDLTLRKQKAWPKVFVKEKDTQALLDQVHQTQKVFLLKPYKNMLRTRKITTLTQWTHFLRK